MCETTVGVTCKRSWCEFDFERQSLPESDFSSRFAEPGLVFADPTILTDAGHLLSCKIYSLICWETVLRLYK